MVYGDTTLAKLLELGGFANRKPGDSIRTDKLYQRIRATSSGWGRINRILADNPDASYHGKEVGPDDKDRILLRWKLKDGSFQTIYGDLRTEKTQK